jgi:hypothetical protein
MVSITELLSAAAAPETDDVDVLLADQVVTFRFTKLDGDRWAELCGKFPPRPGNTLDLAVDGYNIDAVVNAAVKINGVRIDGDRVESIAEGQWDMILTALSGSDVKNIRDVIWNLNEGGPMYRLEAAKKALTTLGNGTSSPSDSE